jgi:hypothetical protein
MASRPSRPASEAAKKTDPGDRETIYVRLPLELVRRIKVHCAESGITITTFAEEAFRKALTK